jgi:8-oxo-dGTP pyrophosphatase MutT (NUDIX family)
MDNKFTVAVTAIIRKGDKFLITKRTATKKKWPNKWTVPGGKVEVADFLGTPTPINNQWYHVLENAVEREVKEETGIHICNLKYLASIAVPDTIIISFTADLDGSGEQEPKLQLEECDEYAWVTKEEAANYDLIDGILDEIKIA